MSASESVLRANRQAAEHGIDLSKLPKMMDMSAESITSNVHATNLNCTSRFSRKEYGSDVSIPIGTDPRTKFLFTKLVSQTAQITTWRLNLTKFTRLDRPLARFRAGDVVDDRRMDDDDPISDGNRKDVYRSPTRSASPPM